MKIAPISFGKSVQVLGSKDTAYDIARLANERKVSKSERSAQKTAKAIFDDTSIAPAQVATYKTSNGEEKVYIVSGKESESLDALTSKTTDFLIQAGETLNNNKHFEKFSNIVMERLNNKTKRLLLTNREKYKIEATYNNKQTSIKSIDKIQ